MADFTDRLWRDLVREHGAGLERIEREPPRRLRPRVLAGGTLGLAGLGTVVALVAGATRSSPAFAIDRHADGTVTLRIYRADAIAAANARLAALGVRVRAIPMIEGCTARLHGARVQVPAGAVLPSDAMVRALRSARRAVVSVGIAPGKIARGVTLVLAARPAAAQVPSLTAQRLRGAVPACAGFGPNVVAPTRGTGVVCAAPSGRVPPPTAAGARAAARRQRLQTAGNSGDSGNSGNSGAGTPPPSGPVTCQVEPAPADSGNSGNSG